MYRRGSAQQDAATPNHDQRNRVGARLHAIHRLADGILDSRHRGFNHVAFEVPDRTTVANLRPARCDGDVGGVRVSPPKISALLVSS